MIPPERRAQCLLAVNPSHSSPLETRFWEQLGRAAAGRGWQLVAVAARAIPDVPAGHTAPRLPARLADFARLQRDRPAAELTSRPPWLPFASWALHVEWEHRRWDMSTYDPAVGDGALRLAWYADEVVRALRPAVVLTTNKIDHPCAFFRAAAEHHGVPTLLVERSPFTSIWVEPDGLFTESEIWDAWSTAAAGPDAAVHGASVIDAKLANPAGFRPDEAPNLRDEPAGWDHPRLFLPMDNLLWTGWLPARHPQGRVDNPAFDDPQDAVDMLGGLAAAAGGGLVVKAHPSCLETRRLRFPPGTRLVNADLDALVAASDVVVAFNTKVAFLALAMGATTVTLADNPAAAAGLTVHYRDFASPQAAVEHALAARPTPHPAQVAEFFGWLDRHYFYALDDAAGTRGPSALVERLLAAAPAGAGQPSPAALARLDELSAGETAGTVPEEPAPHQRVVLEVSRLVEPAARHSGIARYGRELVDHLAEHTDLEIWAAVKEPPTGWSRLAGPLFERLHERLGHRVAPYRASPAGALLRRLGGLSARDVFHSIHTPLPGRRATGEAARAVTVHDVLHLRHPHLYDGPSPPTISRVLDSIDLAHDHAICVSEQTRRDLMMLLPIPFDHTHVILHGVGRLTTGPAPEHDISLRRARAHPEGFVATMLQADIRKNMAGAVAGIGAVLERRRGLGAVLMCSLANFDEVREAAGRARLPDDRITYLADPKDDLLAIVLAEATAFVFATRYEGFGLPALEAMAARCPVVMPLNSSLVEVGGDAAVYATSPEGPDIAAALELALAPWSLAERRARGAQRAARLAWERTVIRHAEVYERLASVPVG